MHPGGKNHNHNGSQPPPPRGGALIWGWVIWGLLAVTRRLVLIITGYQHQDDLMHHLERAGSASISLSYPGKPSDELAQQMR